MEVGVARRYGDQTSVGIIIMITTTIMVKASATRLLILFLSFFMNNHHLKFPTGSGRLAACVQQPHFVDEKTEAPRNLVNDISKVTKMMAPGLQPGFSETNLTVLC